MGYLTGDGALDCRLHLRLALGSTRLLARGKTTGIGLIGRLGYGRGFVGYGNVWYNWLRYAVWDTVIANWLLLDCCGLRYLTCGTMISNWYWAMQSGVQVGWQAEAHWASCNCRFRWLWIRTASTTLAITTHENKKTVNEIKRLYLLFDLYVQGSVCAINYPCFYGILYREVAHP